MMRTITPVLSLVIAITLFFSVTRPMLAEIRTIQDETEEYQDAVRKADALNGKLNALVAKRNSFNEIDMDRLNTFIAEDVDEVKLLADLKALSVSHGTYIFNVNVVPGREVEKSTNSKNKNTAVSYDDFQSVDISFALVGTYDQFKGMLKDIERSLVPMEVVGLEFTAAESDLMQFSITIRSYALPNAE